MLVRGETEPVRAATVQAWVGTVPVVCAETVPARKEAVPVCAKTTQVWVETVQETVQVWLETVQAWVETVQTRAETVELWVETGAETGAGARGTRTAPVPEVRDTDTDRAR